MYDYNYKLNDYFLGGPAAFGVLAVEEQQQARSSVLLIQCESLGFESNVTYIIIIRATVYIIEYVDWL